MLSVGGAVGSGWQEPRDVSRRRSRRRRRRRSSSGGAAAARLSTPTLLLSASSSLGPAQSSPSPSQLSWQLLSRLIVAVV